MCRTMLGYDINGFGLSKDGRGNICPVTIIMPTLAMQALENTGSDDSEINFKEFMRILKSTIEDAKEILLERFNHICSQPPESGKFMYENNVMRGYIPEEGIKSALKHGTLAIGKIGLAETLQILFGFNHTNPLGLEKAKEIENLFKTKCSSYKTEYHLNFANYNTPAESLCYTSLKKFREKYGVIEKVSDREYFTNSIHVPVWEDISPFDKIDIESQLTGYSGAGCITYVELDAGVMSNTDALETIVTYAMEKDIPYFAANIPNDGCLDCGYIGEFNDKCPNCESENIQQLRRVTGYLTGNYKTAFNKGKIAETEQRVKHTGVKE